MKLEGLHLIFPQMWRTDFGWLPNDHPATLSLPLPNRTGEKIWSKSSWIWIKTQRSILYQLQSWTKQTWFGKN